MASSAEVNQLITKKNAQAKLTEMLALFEDPTPEGYSIANARSLAKQLHDLVDASDDVRIKDQLDASAVVFYEDLFAELTTLKTTIDTEIGNFTGTDTIP